MTALETDCLKQDDVRLFHKGACHIFAATLKAKLANEAYVLRRVLLKREFDMQGAHHVFAAKGEFVVDAIIATIAVVGAGVLSLRDNSDASSAMKWPCVAALILCWLFARVAKAIATVGSSSAR